MTNEHRIMSMEQHRQFLNMEEARKYICDENVEEALRVLREVKASLYFPYIDTPDIKSWDIQCYKYYICFAIEGVCDNFFNRVYGGFMNTLVQGYVTIALGISPRATILKYMKRYTGRPELPEKQIMQCRHDVLQCLIDDLIERSNTK